MGVAIIELLVIDDPAELIGVEVAETGSETEVAVPLKDRYQLA